MRILTKPKHLDVVLLLISHKKLVFAFFILTLCYLFLRTYVHNGINMLTCKYGIVKINRNASIFTRAHFSYQYTGRFTGSNFITFCTGGWSGIKVIVWSSVIEEKSLEKKMKLTDKIEN